MYAVQHTFYLTKHPLLGYSPAITALADG